jgi:hypothetical protein
VLPNQQQKAWIPNFLQIRLRKSPWKLGRVREHWILNRRAPYYQCFNRKDPFSICSIPWAFIIFTRIKNNSRIYSWKWHFKKPYKLKIGNNIIPGKTPQEQDALQ